MNREDGRMGRKSPVQDTLSETVIGAALDVHTMLGAGLLESAYEECLCHELTLRRIGFSRQASLPLDYKGIRLDCGYRIDILIPNALIVEIKSVDKLLPVHQAQLITYLRLTGISTGLLINFNVPHLRQGIRRLKAAREAGITPSRPPILPVKSPSGVVR